MPAATSPEPTTAVRHVHIAIVGTGFAGLAAAVHLQRDGERDLLILERAEDVGGVWRDNTYPGAACDVPSHLYSLSFAPNPGWTRSFSRQHEILEYLRSVATDFGLRPLIHFGEELHDATWDEMACRWDITTTGMHLTADVIIDGCGPLTEPALPAIPGLADFAGTVFHSARWDHDYDLQGKRVAVIGTGASSIQFVPEIQPLVDHLVLVQRTAPWVVPRNDRTITAAERRLLAKRPGLQRLARGTQYLTRELLHYPLVKSPRLRRMAERVALGHLHRQVKDPALRVKLTPNYEIGCKRILISNAWYPAVAKPNVQVVTGLAEVRAHSVVTSDGVEHPVDAIILGTGFHV
ncbi:MAG: hapE2, partial [Solirubrobacterales bacterium]|nr:hapE2 [Solirubrobacterales bacterium]